MELNISEEKDKEKGYRIKDSRSTSDNMYYLGLIYEDIEPSHKFIGILDTIHKSLILGGITASLVFGGAIMMKLYSKGSGLTYLMVMLIISIVIFVFGYAYRIIRKRSLRTIIDVPLAEEASEKLKTLKTDNNDTFLLSDNKHYILLNEQYLELKDIIKQYEKSTGYDPKVDKSLKKIAKKTKSILELMLVKQENSIRHSLC